jgi:hypothetical protein
MHLFSRMGSVELLARVLRDITCLRYFTQLLAPIAAFPSTVLPWAYQNTGKPTLSGNVKEVTSIESIRHWKILRDF